MNKDLRISTIARLTAGATKPLAAVAAGSASMSALAHEGPAHWHPEIGAALLAVALVGIAVFGFRHRLKSGAVKKNRHQ